MNHADGAQVNLREHYFAHISCIISSQFMSKTSFIGITSQSCNSDVVNNKCGRIFDHQSSLEITSYS